MPVERSPFRPAALRRYAAAAARLAPRPPVTEPPAHLWLAAAALAGLLGLVGSVELPTWARGVAVEGPAGGRFVLVPAERRAGLAVGQPVRLDGAEHARWRVAAVEPEPLAPGAAAERFGLAPEAAGRLAGPAGIAVAVVEPPADPTGPIGTLPARVQVGQRTLLSRILSAGRAP